MQFHIICGHDSGPSVNHYAYFYLPVNKSNIAHEHEGNKHGLTEHENTK